ncbi:hypothetical protein BDV29DRAFT_162684 [Aspergillus leporis]|uniref:Uncharacterized protein n=1 Tax=Aspergillus leporis TaxID=41062 RepID=A0A5N5WI02_9EURO|nr:hypothetical protein BDV29DRAFT_162684 [Aspergillus leporis]
MPTRDHSSHRPSRSHQRSDSRSRSRSPDRHRRHHHHHHHHHRRDRDREHRSHRRHHKSHDHDRHSEKHSSPKPIVLPFQARELHKRDLTAYEPMFAMYLDIQKGIIIEDLSEEEVKGRWKSFINKWNRGELAEGWYDPSTLEKARRNAQDEPLAPAADRHRESPVYDREAGSRQEGNPGDDEEEEEDDDDDDYGPVLPQHGGMSRYEGRPGQPSGPTIPTMQDLELRKEFAVEDDIAAREDSWKQRRAEVRSHRSELRHIEDEVAPRAEPGTHERRMEKRQEAAAANRAFAEARRGGSPDGAPDEDIMGSGENELDDIKRAKAQERRKKNEREIRREEILRARAAEREERLQQYRQKEEETIGWLKTLAKQRYG